MIGELSVQLKKEMSNKKDLALKLVDHEQRVSELVRKYEDSKKQYHKIREEREKLRAEVEKLKPQQDQQMASTENKSAPPEVDVKTKYEHLK
eukprot:CAMPEP_0116872940 /NCGR_PEP_ID=MMETSP0463-20121206/3882_1 /TAXON_ID=181622 /ORGANISM="Strombidinopsis sp, Strain SopsisLIS2011" /LENGTH=91 /DNA_ID=CAMNT_0004514047 /DNA_START=1518 /DNA_END=1793 /DNA_ORIENTATION=+